MIFSGSSFRGNRRMATPCDRMEISHYGLDLTGHDRRRPATGTEINLHSTRTGRPHRPTVRLDRHG